MIIKFKKLDPKAILPSVAHLGDAGMDMFSIEDYVLKPGERHTFSTGISSELPEGFFVHFADKSGLANQNGIQVLGGVIDNGYRGEWTVTLLNTGSESREFKAGDKLTQGILQKIEEFEVEETKDLSETERGANGFGSTGR